MKICCLVEAELFEVVTPIKNRSYLEQGRSNTHHKLGLQKFGNFSR